MHKELVHLTRCIDCYALVVFSREASYQRARRSCSRTKIVTIDRRQKAASFPHSPGRFFLPRRKVKSTRDHSKLTGKNCRERERETSALLLNLRRRVGQIRVLRASKDRILPPESFKFWQSLHLFFPVKFLLSISKQAKPSFERNRSTRESTHSNIFILLCTPRMIIVRDRVARLREQARK